VLHLLCIISPSQNLSLLSLVPIRIMEVMAQMRTHIVGMRTTGMDTMAVAIGENFSDDKIVVLHALVVIIILCSFWFS
jgi:uncharacterized membrane protein